MQSILVPAISYAGLVAFCAVALTALASILDRIVHTTIISSLRTRFAPQRDLILFGSTLITTLASLSLSEILHFAPCVLCWYQRIAMYPQVVLTYLGLIRQEMRMLKPYLLILNSIGAIVALYHYSLHILPRHMVAIAPCAADVGGVPCDKGYDMFFGFMTFPLMAAAVFVLNICLLTVYDVGLPVKKKKSRT